MSYTIEVKTARARPTAVVASVTTWAAFPSVWRPMLHQVYAFLKDSGVRQDGHNIMLYLDARPSVEVGVEVDGPFAPRGNVRPSELPAGEVAWTIHRGPFHEVGAAHEAVRAWCKETGNQLAGPCWEIYGDWHEDPALLETEVCYLLQRAD
jgi:effector-binding domain-containing protein